MNSVKGTVLFLVCHLIVECHLSEASPAAQINLGLPSSDTVIEGAKQVECAIRSHLPGFTGLKVDKDGKVCKDQEGGHGQTTAPSKGDHDGACASKPCLYDGTCEKVSDKSGNADFRCTCQYPMGGKTCADLICESCFRKDDLVIFLNNTTPTTTWIQSYEWCHDKGMHLLLDKDQDKHDFVTEVLKKVHPDLDEHVAYWIGLNRTSKTNPWTYTDGTPVIDSFEPWMSGRPQSGLCVEVANGQEFKWLWDDEDCDGESGWSYYPICEKHYPFLKATV